MVKTFKPNRHTTFKKWLSRCVREEFLRTLDYESQDDTIATLLECNGIEELDFAVLTYTLGYAELSVFTTNNGYYTKEVLCEDISY